MNRQAHRPWPRAVVTDDGWSRRSICWRRTLHAARPVGRRAATCTWRLLDEARATSPCSLTPARTANIPASAPTSAGLRLERAIRDLFGLDAIGSPDTRPWLDLGFWDVAHPLGKRQPRARASALRLPAGGRRGPAPDSGRPRACRHHRAGTFPFHRQWRARGAAGAAARLCAQGHRVADGRRIARATPPSWPRRTSGDSTVAYSYAFALAAEAALQVKPPPRAAYLRALMAELERLANHFGDIGAICNDASFALMHAQTGILRERVLARGGSLLRPPADDGRHRARRRRARHRAGRRGAVARAAGRSHASVFPRLIELYDNTASLQDRTVTTGIVQRRLCAPVRRRRLCRPRLGPRLRCPREAWLRAL